MLPKIYIKCQRLLHYIIVFGLVLGINNFWANASFVQQPPSLGVFMVRSPESIVAPQGDEVLFECQLNLVPERLEWRFRQKIQNTTSNEYIYLHASNGYNITHDDGKSNLRINVSPMTIGEYQCVAWFGSSAIASIPAKLTLASISLSDDYIIEPNRRINRPEQMILRWRVSPNNSVLIKCGNVISNPSAVWSFFKDNISIPQSAPQLSSGSLVLPSVTVKDSGIYSCSAVNPITGIKIGIPQSINLLIEPGQQTPPKFLIEPPTRKYARLGQTIILECPGIGNPPPNAVWSRTDDQISNNRSNRLEYGLQIIDVNSKDRGTYVCRLDNGVVPVLVHSVRLEILEPPIIQKGPIATLTNEDDSLELECIATGSPNPDIYWMINGAEISSDHLMQQHGSKLILQTVKKRHAGIVQCFAKNEVGEVNESNLLQVNPKQIPGEIGVQPLGSFPTKTSYDYAGKQNKGRKKHKIPNMIPPSRPNVTRLSDDSVMIRWYIPKNDGLQIQFFKVQYRMLGNPAKKIPRENWQTTNEDILYGKHDKNGNGLKNFTSAVTGLKADRYYRFRILAVYSNNDNKEGNSSGKFLLQRASQLGPSKSHIPAPILSKVEGISETEILLHWTFPENKSNPVDGFYAYYRPASTAGEYTKATIDGMQARQFKIDMLEPGTAYEFKLQSFTSSAASDFSSILTERTLKPPTPPPLVTPTVIAAIDSPEGNSTIFPVIAGAAGGALLLLIAAIVACFCVKKKSAQQEGENKPQLEHIQAEESHFVAPTVISSQHHKTNHRTLNGVASQMNITPNPLAQDGDKNCNVMELHYLAANLGLNGYQHQQNLLQQQQQQKHQYHCPSTTLPISVAPSSLHDYKSENQSITPIAHSPNEQHFVYSSNGNYQQSLYQQSPITLSIEQYRRTLEGSARSLHCTPPSSPHHHSGLALDVIDGLQTKIPSLRKVRRTSGSANNNSGGGGGLNQNINATKKLGIPGSPRVPRSPMPIRTAAAIKRNRLGSHSDAISFSSLNSIEV